MKEYHKIQSVYKRDMDNGGKIIVGSYTTPAFEYLKGQRWLFEEKVDGTNIRVHWDGDVWFGGRTDNAQIPTFLLSRLQEMFTPEKLRVQFPDGTFTLYGEGYGAKIQKGGGNYIADGVDFCLFDVFSYNEYDAGGGVWLRCSDVSDVAYAMGLTRAPFIDKGTLYDLTALCMQGFTSEWGDFPAEGIVARPEVDLYDRRGHRVITKLKLADFKEGRR